MNETQETDAIAVPRQIDWSLLRPYGRVLEVMGSLLVAMFVCACVMLFYVNFFLYPSARVQQSFYDWFGVPITGALRLYLFPGLVLLMLAQVLRCLGDREFAPRWILRQGHWILFLYGAFLLEFLIRRSYHVFAHSPDIDQVNGFGIFLTMVGLPDVPLIIVVVGVGVALRRLVSILEESKTLV